MTVVGVGMDRHFAEDVNNENLKKRNEPERREGVPLAS
jgi:hypothetical protein